jgi:hypothetical protein
VSVADKNDNHGCAAGTIYKAMGPDDKPICQSPPAKFVPPPPAPKSLAWKVSCTWVGDAAGAAVGGAAGLAVTGLASETGPAAPYLGWVAGFVVGGSLSRAFNNSFCQ